MVLVLGEGAGIMRLIPPGVTLLETFFAMFFVLLNNRYGTYSDTPEPERDVTGWF